MLRRLHPALCSNLHPFFIAIGEGGSAAIGDVGDWQMRANRARGIMESEISGPSNKLCSVFFVAFGGFRLVT